MKRSEGIFLLWQQCHHRHLLYSREGCDDAVHLRGVGDKGHKYRGAEVAREERESAVAAGQDHEQLICADGVAGAVDGGDNTTRVAEPEDYGVGDHHTAVHYAGHKRRVGSDLKGVVAHLAVEVEFSGNVLIVYRLVMFVFQCKKEVRAEP